MKYRRILFCTIFVAIFTLVGCGESNDGAGSCSSVCDAAGEACTAGFAGTYGSKSDCVDTCEANYGSEAKKCLQDASSCADVGFCYGRY